MDTVTKLLRNPPKPFCTAKARRWIAEKVGLLAAKRLLWLTKVIAGVCAVLLLLATWGELSPIILLTLGLVPAIVSFAETVLTFDKLSSIQTNYRKKLADELDEISRTYFHDSADFRVTLMVRESDTSGQDYLVPCLRAGTFKVSGQTKLRLDETEQNCEGAAGLAWLLGQQQFLQTDSDPNDESQLDKYLKDMVITRDTLGRMSKRRPKFVFAVMIREGNCRFVVCIDAVQSRNLLGTDAYLPDLQNSKSHESVGELAIHGWLVNHLAVHIRCRFSKLIKQLSAEIGETING